MASSTHHSSEPVSVKDASLARAARAHTAEAVAKGMA